RCKQVRGINAAPLHHAQDQKSTSNSWCLCYKFFGTFSKTLDTLTFPPLAFLRNRPQVCVPAGTSKTSDLQFLFYLFSFFTHFLPIIPLRVPF
ncbi:hypothetical protein, partial [Anaerotalea alkaliphila]|uniref:hypothetical protein n=1 Tax=Anaerotalea alkaliphila TaxID=2662126 RepID=UPI001BA8B3FA